MAEQSQEDLVELEIGAFMGPHIKRARIALVLIGLFYMWIVYRTYGDLSDAHDAMKRVSESDPDLAELKHRIDLGYYFIVLTGFAGIANIVLGVIAGRITTLAIYAAMGIFAVHSCFQLYMSGALLFTSWLWWLSAIILGLGFEAAYKAAKLRRERTTTR